MMNATRKRKQSLTVSAVLARTNARLDDLRQTADIANATIMQNNFSSQTDLNAKRGDAATALRGVSGSWASGRPLTRDLLSRAQIAVEAWLSSLTAQESSVKSEPFCTVLIAS
jgi:hypothetical protein